MEAKKTDTGGRELLITRKLNAPVGLVWEAWTDPGHIAKWWGPDGFTNTITKMDIRPGGEWNLVMHGPDGTDFDNRSIFKEIVPFKRIVYEHVSYPYILATIEFEDLGEQTLLKWHMLFESAEEFLKVVKTYKADKGLEQNVAKLDVYLSKMK
jgi:uncharacterized protein YndB with AHSA1/START domain